MKPKGDCSLMEVLKARKKTVVEVWLTRTLETYPEHTRRFLLREKDRFRNPVGHAFQEALPALFDELLGERDGARLEGLLDTIVRIRAVQDFSAAQAVGFIFLLKNIIREEARKEGEEAADALTALEGRIDELALLASGLYAKCREQILAIQAGESRRRMYLVERMQGRKAG
ncbi:MAG: RsbRD N-terminal domain-containing protein [Candidatus Tectomicrobia bacterium]|uniref:RsbRD N-terminal domain-containing protein n=1 Tax=Tectimicrobiota bacterium TaxID=2528274 RepID=A0A932M085_UNCTE|nr:RsbRD N-terminal domain-containing protein [Candidatus Tectomicrobia bacterium]